MAQGNDMGKFGHHNHLNVLGLNNIFWPNRAFKFLVLCLRLVKIDDVIGIYIVAVFGVSVWVETSIWRSPYILDIGNGMQ